MSSAARSTHITPERYLELEERSEVKHEYYRGELFAMAGATREHILIVTNTSRMLGNQLEDRPCEVYQSEMRVRVDATGLYTYPDVVVVCGPPRFTSAKKTTLLNPTVAVEVLSPSTELYDRTTKKDHYQRIASLREYVLVSQDRVRVDHLALEDGKWIATSWTDLGDVVRLDSIDCVLPLAKIYAKVEFGEAPPLRPVAEDD